MDETPAPSNTRGFFEALQPRAAFWFGILSGLGVLFTIGFFVLLVLFLQKDSTPTASRNTNTAPVATTNTNTAQPPAQPRQITASPVQLAAVSDTDWNRGEANAPVTFVEYSDLECPFCKRFHQTMQQVMQNYQGQVRWVYRHFPLETLHSKAPKESAAAECTGELGGNDAFWKFIDRVYEITPSNDGLDAATLPDIAEYAGVDRAAFQTCLDSGKHDEKVQNQYGEAVTAGGQGTPYSVILIGDTTYPVNGAETYDTIKRFLDAQLQ